MSATINGPAGDAGSDATLAARLDTLEVATVELVQPAQRQSFGHAMHRLRVATGLEAVGMAARVGGQPEHISQFEQGDWSRIPATVLIGLMSVVVEAIGVPQ